MSHVLNFFSKISLWDKKKWLGKCEPHLSGSLMRCSLLRSATTTRGKEFCSISSHSQMSSCLKWHELQEAKIEYNWHQCHPMVSEHGQDKDFSMGQVFPMTITEQKLSKSCCWSFHFPGLEVLPRRIWAKVSQKRWIQGKFWFVFDVKDTLSNLNGQLVIHYVAPSCSWHRHREQSLSLTTCWLVQTNNIMPIFLTPSWTVAFPLSHLPSTQIKIIFLNLSV